MTIETKITNNYLYCNTYLQLMLHPQFQESGKCLMETHCACFLSSNYQQVFQSEGQNVDINTYLLN